MLFSYIRCLKKRRRASYVLLITLILMACTGPGPESQKVLPTPEITAAALQQVDKACLDEEQRLRYSQIINAGQSKPSLDLVRAYISQEQLLKKEGVTHQKNIDKTWQTLLLLPIKQKNIRINSDENVLQGWLELLRLYLNNRQDPNLLQTAIKDWQKAHYPQNPAAKTLPTPLSQIQNYQTLSVGNIAMLLPLSGHEKVFTNAIKQGFISAQEGINSLLNRPAHGADAAGNNLLNSGMPVTSVNTNSMETAPVTGGQAMVACCTANQLPVTLADRNVQVKVYDTTSQTIPAILTLAKKNGARMIIGPLLKNEVEQLYNADTALVDKLNILALNQPDHPEKLQPRPNICYFALAPEDEARDAANHIHQHGRQQPLLLLPRGNLGDRVAKAFTDAWHQAGGSTVLAQRIGSTNELKQSINSGAGIQLTGLPVTGSMPVTITGRTTPNDGSVSSSGRAEGKIDAVYIIATPDELALIKPMIDMNSAHASLALYASSRSYADAGPDYRLEMEGLEFSEIPLLTGTHPALLAQISAQCRGNYLLVRLYAMGIDAWIIANNFSEMRQIPGFQVEGQTGTLSAATPNCVINRKLSWLKYQQGQLIAAQ